MTTDPRRAFPVVADPASEIACTLDAGDVDQRLAAWRDVATRAASSEPIQGGLRLTFDKVDVRALTDLAIREHECCSFLSFSIGIGSGGTTLEITGPDVAPELIAAFG